MSERLNEKQLNFDSRKLNELDKFDKLNKLDKLI